MHTNPSSVSGPDLSPWPLEADSVRVGVGGVGVGESGYGCVNVHV